MYTKPLERDTEYLINTQLQNLSWVLEPKDKKRNVYFQRPKTELQRKALKGNFPDYVLYPTDSDSPLIVIEAKRPQKSIEKAMEQGIKYASALKAPIVFASNGIFTKTFHLKNHNNLILNGTEVEEFIKEVTALKFLNTNEYTSLDKYVIKSRKELIDIFDKANNVLREEEGLQAGVERFSEFANILFLKLISEREDLNEEEGKDFIIDREYRWSFFRDKKGKELLSYINDTVLPKFREEFDDKIIFSKLKISTPKTLETLVDKIDPLYLTDTKSDIKGDAFEYFLKSYSSGNNNDLGQYFTPRHIVKTMVKLLSPTLGERIYDPFCGTGGMLTECFKHINNTMPHNRSSLDTLKTRTLFGREITDIVRIAKMNMILWGDGHNNIDKINSLKNPKKHEYDVVITNIPFAQTTNYGELYDIPSNNGDSVCIQHCLMALDDKNPNSRAAIIVPEGFLFDKVYKREREYLVNRYSLQTVISLPSGVFLPYTPQKASILYVKLKQANQKTIKYFTVHSDGYTLNNYRKRLSGINDLDRLLDGIEFDLLSIKDIAKNNYELIKGIYTSAGFTFKNTKMAFLKDVTVDIKSGQSAPQDLQLFENGTHNFVRVSDLAKEHIVYHLVESRDKLNDKGIKGLTIFPKGTILFPKSGKTVIKNHRAMLGVDSYVVSHLEGIIPNTQKIDPYYLFGCLLNIDAKELLLNEGYPSIRKGVFENIIIPLPSKEKQKTIAKSIRGLVKMEKRKNELLVKVQQSYEQAQSLKGLSTNKSVFDAMIKRASQPIQKERKTKD